MTNAVPTSDLKVGCRVSGREWRCVKREMKQTLDWKKMSTATFWQDRDRFSTVWAHTASRIPCLLNLNLRLHEGVVFTRMFWNLDNGWDT